MSDQLTVKDNEITGEIALAITPGTVADEQNRALDAALAAMLDDAAGQLGAVVAAPPHRFVRPIPGKDDQGRLRFSVRARAEGGRLVPAHGARRRH